MRHTTLIRLYFDEYGALKDSSPQAIVVTDLQSYAGARRAIEELKAGDIAGPLTVIVHSHRFYAGFHDLSPFGDLVESTSIAPRDGIRRTCHIQVPSDLTDRDLITLGIPDATELLAVAGPDGIHDQDPFDDALLLKAFGTSVFKMSAGSDFEGWFRELVALLYAAEACTKPGWGVAYSRHLAMERTRAILGHFGKEDLAAFVTDGLKWCASGEAHTRLSQLVVRYWLNNYSKLARKVVIGNLADCVGSWFEINNEVAVFDALSPSFESLYLQPENPLTERLEGVLRLLLDEGSLIEEEDFGQYVQQVSGRFAAEYDWVQQRLGKLLLEAHGADTVEGQRSQFLARLALVERRFVPLFQRTAQPTGRTGWVDALLELNDVMSHLDEAAPSHWADWLATYELLIRAKHLRGQVQDTAPGACVAQLGNVTAFFSVLDERLNSAFADWLLAEYPKLVSSSVHEPLLALDAARLALDRVAKGGKVILLVLDALDWELWQSLRCILGRHGFVVQGNEAGLAILPTITEFSRRALFGGLTPRNLSRFVDDIYGSEISPAEEAKTLARALGYLGRVEQLKALPDNKRIRYLGGELVYANGSDRDLGQILGLDAKCYAFVYAEIDSHIHGAKLAEPELKRSVVQWFEHLVEELVRGIRQNPSLRDEANLQIIVASDHGFLDVSEQQQAELEASLMSLLDLERHGRLAIARVKSEGDIDSAQQALKHFYDSHSAAWHVVWRAQAEQFGLAESSPSEGEVVAWLMPRLLQYLTKGKGNYVHGGLSMYEAIVPVALLSRGEFELEAPVVTLTGRLASEEEGALTIAILNKSDQPVRDVVVHIPELALMGSRAGDIGPDAMKKLEVTVIPPKAGDIAVQVVLEAEIGGLPKRFVEKRVLAVQAGRRERLRLSTRRSLDDEVEP